MCNLYITMLAENDQSVDWCYAISAKVLAWTLLVGYIVIPPAFAQPRFCLRTYNYEIRMKAIQKWAKIRPLFKHILQTCSGSDSGSDSGFS
ncbi:hypothetical protein BKA67DRAFT_551633 [Truncatella angustata]|uniref:Uncharacterized protein n=1 Tax=Truncatella angustata TaxID=152316 RepID=A0A9P8UQE0_9PEZI|nr:uncharacterized protein BKA67DRAFT_551633 [Truncatella angustata]KAH6656333.1 hypothetical protein BKA67DRAFT_551633 [Truncatella angustata]